VKLLNLITDKLQALFPPNRVAILLAGTITAVSGTIAAWLATNFPGLALGAPEIAGVLGAALLITLRLLDRWFDTWQKGGTPDFEGDLEFALEEFLADPEMRRLFMENHPELGTALLADAGIAPVAADSSPAPPAE
jgi:hypothetical protein